MCQLASPSDPATIILRHVLCEASVVSFKGNLKVGIVRVEVSTTQTEQNLLKIRKATKQRRMVR